MNVIQRKIVNFCLKLKDQKVNLLIALFFLTLFNISFTVKGQNTDSLSNEEVITPLDSINTINIPKVDSSLKSIINYDAVDSILFDVANQSAILYGQGHLDYGEISVDAPKIKVNFQTSLLEATASYDSTGKITEYPFLVQEEDEFQADTILFNWQTNRGYISEVYTQEGDGFLFTKEAYLASDKTLFVKNASFTTCNLQNPHYHFRLRKAKVIPNDKVIARLVNLYIDSIPTPLGLPFGLFPTNNQRSSGILIPTNGNNELGFFLEDFGYYWAVNNRLAVKFLGEVYSRGSFGASIETDYKVRYKYSGNIDFNFRNIVNNSDEFGRDARRTVKLVWRHNPVARNGRRLISDVNFETVSFNRFNFNETSELTRPTINSSISYDLPFKGLPFRANVQARHDQNKTNGVNTFTLPSFSIFYEGPRNPFKLLPHTKSRPSKFRKNILDQFTVRYTLSGNNTISTDAINYNPLPFDVINPIENSDTVLQLNRPNLGDILRRGRFSATHSAAISNNIKLKYFTLTPNLSYAETWFFNRSEFDIRPTSDSTTGISVNDDPGLHRIGRLSTSATLSTSLFNFYTLGRKPRKKYDKELGDTVLVDKRIKIRQTITPNISYNFSPSYQDDPRIFSTESVSDTTDEEVLVDRFFLFPRRPSTPGESQSINFSLNNVFELKLPKKNNSRSEDDSTANNTAAAPNRPIKLFNLNASTGYNFVADSLRLRNITVSLVNSNLLNGLMSITTNATFDPYQFDSVGTSVTRVDRFWAADSNPFSNNFPARLSQAGIRANLSLNPSIFNSFRKNTETIEDAEKEFERSYTKFSIPWTLNINYNLNWTQSNPFVDAIIRQGLIFSGRLTLSEKWSASYKVNYDLQEKEFQFPNLTLERDLHCWYMRLNWVPFGPPAIRSYQFFIGVRAGILDSLKYNRRNSPQDRLNF